MISELYNLLKKYSGTYHPVVPFDARKDKLLKLDFTGANPQLTEAIISDTNTFSAYIEKLLGKKYTYGIGGYDEHRTVYARSKVFDDEEEPRRLHLGIDIWGSARYACFCSFRWLCTQLCFQQSFWRLWGYDYSSSSNGWSLI